MELVPILGSLLIVYCWIVAAILVFFLFLIGRFYEVRFKQKSYYQLFLLPLSLFVLAAIGDTFLANRYTGNPLLDYVGAFWYDLMLLVGGLVLIALCYSLFRTMMGGRR
jgi:membrane protease YdiL (CAAX protease family)